LKKLDEPVPLLVPIFAVHHSLRASPRGEVADELREEAASYRRLALRARTNRGSTALKTAADQFDQDARRIDPSSLKR
jgi:hypothetical protein